MLRDVASEGAHTVRDARVRNGCACTHGRVERGFDRDLSPVQRMFLYLPSRSSESIDETDARAYSRTRSAIAASFAARAGSARQDDGRFPHRNRVIGRTSTADEIAFLATPGSSF